MTETEKPSQVDVETVGIDEMVRQDRVRSIFDARNTCRERRTKAKTNSGLGEVGEWSVIYRTALESYIREVEPLIAQTQDGMALWNETDFGVLDLTPKHSEVGGTKRQTGRIPPEKIIDAPGRSREVAIRGLGALFELDTPHRATFEIALPGKRRGRADRRDLVTVERDVPIGILDSMYASVNAYLGEIGFGVEVGEAQQHTKLDDDLLDEVEQWRRENL